MRRVEPPQDALVHLGVGDVDVGHAVDPPGDLDKLVELLDKLRDLSSEADTGKTTTEPHTLFIIGASSRLRFNGIVFSMARIRKIFTRRFFLYARVYCMHMV